MKYVVAVSGGVDSVALLDMLVREGKHELIVAHFDHGIRPNSEADARFVAGLADIYNLPIEMRREELGQQASEALARARRYSFLQKISKKYNAQIMTAHHKNDLIETIAINVSRGTGWRGVAVFGNHTITRPLLAMTKQQIYDYALERNLEWVEDETNQQPNYLRNRLRLRIGRNLSQENSQQLHELWSTQTKLRRAIDNESERIVSANHRTSRYFFTNTDEASACELLVTVMRAANASLTRPQRLRVLHAIKTAGAGTTFEAGNGVSIKFTTREFIVKNSSGLLL